MEKYLEADHINSTISSLTQAHRQEFAKSRKIVAGRAAIPSIDQLAKIIYKNKVTGKSFLALKVRKIAKLESLEEAKNEWERLEKLEAGYQKNAQLILDKEWEELLSNNPESVFTKLTAAFGDNEAKATPISVQGSKVDIVMLAPSVGKIPERQSGITPTGRVSVRQMKVAERKAIYFDIVFSHALATALEAFASAPGLTGVNLVVVRNESNSKLLNHQIVCLGFGLVDKNLLEQQDLRDEPYKILAMASPAWISNLTNSLDLKPVNLEGEEELSRLINSLSDEDI